MRTFISIAALTVLSGIAAPAMASSQADISKCRAAVAERVGEGATVSFEAIRGASVKTVTFEVTKDGEKSDATCKIRRGKIQEVTV